MDRELKIGVYKHFKNKLYKSLLLYDGNIIDDNINCSKYNTLGQAINANTDETVYILIPPFKNINNSMIIVDKDYHIIKGKYVIYKALYSPYGLYIREYNNFMSEVDKEKYPEITQKYRFELI